MPLPFIAIATTAWGFFPGWAKIAMGGAVALFVSYQVGHWKGDNYRNAVWEKQIAAEKEKQRQVVQVVDNEAVATVIKLHQDLEKRDAQIALLLAEADQDANAARVCLGTPSLRRINRGR